MYVEIEPPETALLTLVKETLAGPAAFCAPASDGAAELITYATQSTCRALLVGLRRLAFWVVRSVVCLGLQGLGLLIVHGLRYPIQGLDLLIRNARSALQACCWD